MTFLNKKSFKEIRSRSGFLKVVPYKPNRFDYTHFETSSKEIPKLIDLHTRGVGFKDKKSFKRILNILKVLRSKSSARLISKSIKLFKIIYGTSVNHTLIVKFIEFMEKIIFNHGFEISMTIFKEISGYALRYSVGHTSKPVKLIKYYGDDKFPLILKGFRGLLDGDYGSKSAALTILDFYRIYGVSSSIPDIKGITKDGVLEDYDYHNLGFTPGTFFLRMYQKTDDIFWFEIKKIWSDVLEETFPKDLREQRLNEVSNNSTINLSSKAGPNCQSLPSSIYDFIALTKARTLDGSSLMDHIINMARITENFTLLKLIEHYSFIYNKNPNLLVLTKDYDQFNKLGKLVIKPEVAKSRWIAIVDFFTQSALKGMHIAQADWLKAQPEDGTFCQNESFNSIRDLSCVPSDENNLLSSQDLTEATNALSSDLSSEIIHQMYGSRVSILWKTLCTDRDFYLPDNSIVRYKVGQPMGTFTSFTMLAITNHLIARTAMRYNNIYPQSREIFYYIVGDDFVCKNLYFAETYKLILDSIGVLISVMKGYTYLTSKVYLQTNSIVGIPNVAEFVKRVCIDGYEIGPIRIKILQLGLSEPIHSKLIFDVLYHKNYQLDLFMISEILGLTYNPKKSGVHLMNPIDPCLYFRDIYNTLSFNDNVFTVMDNLIFDNFKNYSISDTDIITSSIYSSIQIFDGTFNDYYKTFCDVISNNLLRRAKNSIQKIKNLISKDIKFGNEIIDEDFINKSLFHQEFGFTIEQWDMLSPLFIFIYLKSEVYIREASKLLKFGDFTVDNIDRIKLLLTSLFNINQIMMGKKSYDKDPLSESVVLNDLFLEYYKSISRTKFSTRDVLHSLDVSRLTSLNDIRNSDTDVERTESGILDLKDYFPKSIKTLSNTEKSFYNTPEGFVSTLSDPVKQAMINLEQKFGTNALKLGTSLRTLFKIDNNLKSEIIDQNLMKLFKEDMKINAFIDECVIKPEPYNLIGGIVSDNPYDDEL